MELGETRVRDSCPFPHSGHDVEKIGHVGADVGLAGQNAHVGVESRRGGVVVARAYVGVAHHAFRLAAHHKQSLA